MHVYEVIITAALIETIRVIAKNPQDAIDRARRMFFNDNESGLISEINWRVLT